ncbi:MAG TPA: DapH/DapD/GlmU-related protein [Vicinamibacteria bacterium]|nr:DapH/DapD/GlmU-related protein [Vicinamibacteria bacterium]
MQPNDERIPVVQRAIADQNKSKLQKYRELVVGRAGLTALVVYETVMLLSAWVPGALGLVLRSKLYPLLLGATGRNVTFGQNVVLRHPHKIRIGNDVVVDDNVLLDAKGVDNDGIVLEDGVFIGRNTILSCKNGDIHLEERANIGFNCEIFSAHRVRVGRGVMMAAYVYLVGGDHMRDRLDVAVSEQGRIGLPIEVGEGVWIGAHAVVGGGVVLGEHAIIGAGAMVLEDVPAYQVAAGVPAKIVRDRRKKE